jgi:hypothetical protein
MIRRVVVEYKEDGVAPEVLLEGTWNRRMIDQMSVVLMQALRKHKLEQAKKATQSNVMEEKTDGRKRR